VDHDVIGLVGRARLEIFAPFSFGFFRLLWFDLAIAREAASFGLAPTPLSLWYASTASARPGLLLGIATSPQKRIEASCDRLFEIIDRLT